MDSPSPSLTDVLRRVAELLAARESGPADEREAAEQRLLDALNPSGADFPGDGGPGGWLYLLRRSGHPVAVQTALWSVALGLVDLRRAAYWSGVDFRRWAGEEDGDDGGFRLARAVADAPGGAAEELFLVAELRGSGLALVSAGARRLRRLLGADGRDRPADLPAAARRRFDGPTDAGAAASLRPLGDTSGRMLSGWETLSLRVDLTPPLPANPDDYTVDTFVARGRRFPVRRYDWVPSDAGCPTLCEDAESPPPLAGPELADFLDFAQRVCEDAGLIREGRSVHWCGPRRHGRRCHCPIIRPDGASPPHQWEADRALYRASAAALAAHPGRVRKSKLEAARTRAAARLGQMGRALLVAPVPRLWDMRVIPQELRAVPAGIPKPLAAAYRALADAVAASELYDAEPEPTHGFRDSLDYLAGRRGALLRMHRETFPAFWRWSQGVQDAAVLGGELRTVFGWTVRVGPDTRPNSLRNFPMQANGAEMMRLAACLATERGVGVCCPVHDAFLVEADADAIDAETSRMQGAMREASELVLPGFPLRTDAKVVRHPDRYSDDRGKQMWETVQGILAAA